MNHIISADIATFAYFTRLNWAYLKLYKPSKTVSFKHLVQPMKKIMIRESLWMLKKKKWVESRRHF